MTKYAPTTDSVRYFYSQHTDDGIMGVSRRQYEFDTWLASVKAEVWDEAMGTIDDQWYVTPNPYRAAPNA